MTTEFGDYCCGIDRHLHELLDETTEQRRDIEQTGGEYQAPHMYHVVHISEAEKLTENGSTFIAYTIQFGDYEVKRRYSEFESLRSLLCRLYPTFIVPPIPEKHSLTQYAVLQKRAKEDQYIIGRRKRMLEHFLNHLVEHPILSSEHILHRFLENGASWTEVLHSPIITGLPRSPLHSSPSRAPGSSIADGSSVQLPKIAAANSFACDVAVPSGVLAPIKNIDARWMDCELFTNRFIQQFSGNVEKNQARIYRKLGELAGDYSELGAALNGFSLLEHPEALAAAIESAGQAVDSSYIEINQLLSQMEAEVAEPVHEYSQYAMVIKQVLRFRLLKNLQLDGVQEALVWQRSKLDGLLQADDEAKRLAQALESSSSSNPVTQRSTPAPEPARRPSVAEGSDDEDASLLDNELPSPRAASAAQYQQQQQQPKQHRDNSDYSPALGFAASEQAARQRGRSVSTANHHGEFAPTLASRALGRDINNARPFSFAGMPQTRVMARSRAGTGASIGSAVEPGSMSLAESEDPLALFQQEESQLWGGGTPSTLPRLGASARARSPLKSASGSGSGGLCESMVDDSGLIQHQQSSPKNMARSEYIGQAAPLLGSLKRASMAASTPALREPSEASGKFSGRYDLAPAPAPVSAPVSHGGEPTSGSPESSFGMRFLRTPKVLGDGIMSRLTYALNGMMDVDPEQLRRNQIGRASDRIGVLEEQLEMLSNDLALINTSTQDNLDRFQKQKMRELKGVLIATAKMHLEWAEKNLEIWKDAKEAVDGV